MILTHKIALSLDRREDRPCIDAVQGDTARAVEVSLLDNGTAWLVPEGTSAVIRYTNRIPTATATFDGTQIYQGAGYAAGWRIDSSGNENYVSGFCSTGFIKVSAGDVVRVKNVTLTAANVTYLLTYSTSGSFHTAHTATDVLVQTQGDGVYTYTVPSGIAAIRLSLGVIDASSIVTINEPIE